jgi:hypothetical protein
VRLRFTLLLERFAVARLSPSELPPAWAAGSLVSMTRTADELSIVCRDESVPAGVRVDRGWRCLKLAGPVALTQTGIAAEFTSLLAGSGVSVFVISTYDTDYVLVKEEHLRRACDAFRAAGHAVGSTAGTPPASGRRAKTK